MVAGTLNHHHTSNPIFCLKDVLQQAIGIIVLFGGMSIHSSKWFRNWFTKPKVNHEYTTSKPLVNPGSFYT